MKSTLYGTNPPLLESYNKSSYIELFKLTSNVLQDIYKDGQENGFRAPDLATLLQYSPGIWTDISLCLLGAVVLTILRVTCGNALMNLLSRQKLVLPKNHSRFMESFYVAFFSLLAFTSAFLIERQNGYLIHSERLWEDFSFENTMPTAVWALYIFEISHYVHSLYAVVYINVWNNVDSVAMFVHHIFAILLLSISYLTKTYQMGNLVLYLHDICDVIMEGTKCLLKLELTSKWAIKAREVIKVICFGLLLFFWFYFRLYLFPLRVIFPGVLYSTTNTVDTWFPLSFTLFCLLWLVFILNSYWGMLLLKILIKAIFEGADEIEDPRDVEEVAERERLKKTQKKTKTKSKKLN